MAIYVFKAESYSCTNQHGVLLYPDAITGIPLLLTWHLASVPICALMRSDDITDYLITCWLNHTLQNHPIRHRYQELIKKENLWEPDAEVERIWYMDWQTDCVMMWRERECDLMWKLESECLICKLSGKEQWCARTSVSDMVPVRYGDAWVSSAICRGKYLCSMHSQAGSSSV